SRPYPLDLKLTMGATNVHVAGNFTAPVKLKGIDAKLDVSGSNMADLFYITGIPLPPTPPYKLSGTLNRQTDEWAYNNFSGTVGDSDLAGNLTYDTSGERGFLKAELSSKMVDIDDLGGFIGAAPAVGPGETAAPSQVKQAHVEEQSPHLLPDTPINLKRLRAADMNVALKIDKLMAPHLPFKGMDVVFNLKNGLLTIDPMKLSLADGVADGKLRLDGRKDIPAFATTVDLKKLRLARFFEGSRFEEETQGTFGAHLDLAGNGLSLADILADSNGKTLFLMEGGRISLLLVEAADIDLAEATPLLLGEDKSTQIRCAVGDFKVSHGVLNSEIFILDTMDTKLKGDVAINLKNETIDAVFDAHPKDESPFSLQSPVVVRGSLKHPSVMLEPVETGLRATGAVVLGALLTPFAAIIPFLEVGDEENSNCGALIAAAKNDTPPPQSQ
ncbi:MAG TPA: AsmA family protein, partial [Micavibrio sp.]